MTRHCVIHGDYETRKVPNLNFYIPLSCPVCENENRIQEELKERKRKIDEENKRIELWLNLSDIPKKYRRIDFKPISGQNVSEYNFDKNLLLLGGVGSGKTRYSCALAFIAIKRFLTVRYLVLSDLDRILKSSWNSRTITEKDIIKDFIDCDLLIVDEVGRSSYSEEFFRIIDGRSNEDKPSILIGNTTTEKFKESFGAAISSRLRANLEVIIFKCGDQRGLNRSHDGKNRG